MKRMLQSMLVLGMFGLSAHPRAQNASTWDRLEILVGAWDSKQQTQLGPAVGTATFERELNGRTLVRRSFAKYEGNRPRHDDAMTIYRESDAGPVKAIYFDSEGQVIHYTVTSPAANAIVFESEPSPSGPRYRLAYSRAGNALDGTFEIAMPGAGYKTYLSWTSTRR